MTIKTACDFNGIKINDRRKVSMGGDSKRNESKVTHIARHHSGVNVDQTMAILEGYWKNTHGWKTGGYHVVIHMNGDVDWNYDYDVTSNGVGDHNSYIFNISVLGNGKFTSAQEKSWTVVCKEVQRELGIPTNKVLGHKEFSGHSSNTCPGINMDTVRAVLNNDKPIGNTPSGKNAKPVTKSIETLVAETKAGKHGNGDVRKKKLGSNYDAVMDIINGKSKPKTVAKKFNLPDTEYWVKKPQFSGSGVLVVQNALSSIYFYPNKGAKNNGCDSYYGPKTADAVKRFQSVHGLKADGIYGDATRKKLDSLVNK